MSHIHRSPNVWALGFATMCLAIWASALWWGFFWLCLLGASVWSGWSTAPVGRGGRRAAGRGTCGQRAVLGEATCPACGAALHVEATRLPS